MANYKSPYTSQKNPFDRSKSGISKKYGSDWHSPRPVNTNDVNSLLQQWRSAQANEDDATAEELQGQLAEMGYQSGSAWRQNITPPWQEGLNDDFENEFLEA